jgi:hypothetical protein
MFLIMEKHQHDFADFLGGKCIHCGLSAYEIRFEPAKFGALVEK